MDSGACREEGVSAPGPSTRGTEIAGASRPASLVGREGRLLRSNSLWNSARAAVDRRRVPEEAVDAGDQTRGRLQRHDVESFHQRAAAAQHVPAIAHPVMMTIDLGCDHEPVIGFARPEPPDRMLQLSDADERSDSSGGPENEKPI